MENKQIDDFILMLSDLSAFLVKIKFRNSEMQEDTPQPKQAVEDYLDGLSKHFLLMQKLDALQLDTEKKEDFGINNLFTDKEINLMPKDIKKLLIIDKKRCRIRKHPNRNGYEIRFRRDGYDISASGVTIELAKANFLKKIKSIRLKNNCCEFSVPKTFNAFTIYFFENFRKEKVCPATYRSDFSRYVNYIKPTFNERELNQITPLECKTLLKKVKDSGKGKTADEIYSLLSIIFKGAIKHGILQRNPLDVIYFEKHERKHGSAFSLIEESMLKAKLNVITDKKMKLGLAIMLYTGLRPNELKTAKIENGFIVAINSKRKNKKVEYKKIPIIKALQPFVTSGIIETFSDRTLDKMRAQIKTWFPNHILYDLRTTFYSRCKEYNVAESARDAFVGHSLGSIGNAYTDLSDEYLIKEAKKLDDWE